MGLAASQARLLTITARLADNELRSQTINNAKMRLATQSAQASNDYVNALNNAQLVFTNTDINGLTQTQPLTFKSLTQYSQYNTQYGLVNSSGQMLVSEEDAKIFEANKNSLEGFLKAHGLEWETTYFDENVVGKLYDKIVSYYGTGYSESNPTNGYIGDLFSGMTNADLKNLYLDSISEEASIEALAYKNVCQAYAADIKNGRTVLYPKFVAGALAGKNENEIINEIKGLGSAENVISALLGDNNREYSLAKIKQYMNDPTQIETLVKKLADTHESSGIYLLDEASVADEVTDISPEQVVSITIDGNVLYNATVYNFGGTEIDANHATDESGHKYAPKFSIISANNKTYIKCNQDGYQYKNEYGSYTPLYAEQYAEIKSSATNMGNESEVQDILKNITHSEGSVRIEYNCISTSDGKLEAIRVPFDGTTSKEDAYEAMAREYLSYVLHNPSNFNAMEYAKTNGQYYNEIAEEFESYGLSDVDPKTELDCILDFDTLLKRKNYDSESNNNININTANSKLKSVLKTYMTEKMVDVLGEPKYAWIDKSVNPTDNPDSKAQWLSNLFNRMQKGYRVLENGLANSTEWIEYAFESGLVTMEQVDLSQNWISMDYKTCASINENTDNSAMVAIAEAKYNRAMNDIKQKDSMYDLQLKNIDTEHSALQTEYDVIKDVIKKNIERTMKFDQSA